MAGASPCRGGPFFWGPQHLQPAHGSMRVHERAEPAQPAQRHKADSPLMIEGTFRFPVITERQIRQSALIQWLLSQASKTELIVLHLEEKWGGDNGRIPLKSSY